MGLLGDFMLLDLLLFLSAVPVITAGAGLSAAYYTCFRIMEKRDAGTVRDFLHAFRQNLMHGIVLTLLFLLLGAVLMADGRMLFALFPADGGAGMTGVAGSSVVFCLLTALFFLGSFLYAAVFLYIFPLEARFYNRIPELFCNAAVLSIRNLPRTVLMLLGDAALISVIFLSFRFFPGLAILPILFCLPLALWFNTWMMRKALGLRIGEEDANAEED